ncbi:DGC domain protein [uncultured Desulfobacterium sp.]|uniref:DGC domain protein n=1 Tax=uncultured Desulfobacterium sp. TaxID=201089 RepID=A0A445N3Q8_9BACT|nr:DGC domain protein [uncultured Desulfobacterium sp.]
MAIELMKVGIISCSGEELPGGTVSRIACRKVLDDLRATETVTICLPLFIAGDQGQREFASNYPTITVDGCDKYCAKKSTELLSGTPKKYILVPEILKRHGLEAPIHRRDLNEKEKAAADVVAEEIARAVDEVLNE